jgi:hypothetical protein
MALRDIIKKATAQTVPKVLRELASSTVTTTRYAQTLGPGNRPVNATTNPIVDGEWFIQEITDAAVQRVYGLQSAASAEANVPLDTDVERLDVVRVTAGDFAGEKYEVEQFVRDPLANMTRVALAPTGKTGL